MIIANSCPSAFSRAEQLEFAHFNRSSMEYYQQTTGVPLEPGRCVEYELSSAAASIPLGSAPPRESSSAARLADQLVSGQPMRVLTTVLGFSRESPALKVGLRLRGEDAVQVLNGMEWAH